MLGQKCARPLQILALAVPGFFLAAPTAHAGFDNGGFEANTTMPPTGWTLHTYNRSSVLPVAPPNPGATGITLPNLGLTGKSPGNGVSKILTLPVKDVPATKPNTLTAPRWGNNAFQLNDQGSRLASSIEQTATMTAADIDPIDNKIHIRFGMAPVLVDGGHAPTEQPYFYVEAYNVTKGKVIFHTYNYANQSGIPWQTAGSYKYTDWQGFDVAPGNGQLDVGDQVRLTVYASNCQPGASNHEARVYLDSVGAFMPGLSVTSTGPSTTKPGEQITYTYNYANGSGAISLGTKVRVAAPKTENGLFTTFEPSSIPSVCTAPSPGVAPRSPFIECDIGALTDGQSGSFNVTYTVPVGAATTGPNNVVNNGDYDIRANTVSPFIGPMVKTNIVPVATVTTDLGVTIDNGGIASYSPASSPIYTVTVKNNSAQDVANANITQTVSGLTGGNWSCAVPSGSSASCGATASGSGPIATSTANVPAGQSLVYILAGGTATATGTPVNTVVTVAPPSGTSDTQVANNIAGLNTPVGNVRNVTVNASGAGAGHILAVPSPLSCGSASTACTTTGTTGAVAEGGEVRLTPVAHAGSIFKGWTGCTSTIANLCVVNVLSSDITATALFAKAYIVTPAVDAAGGGSIGPATPQQVESGDSKVFTLVPDAGKVPLINPPASGASCTGALAGNVYTVTAPSSDCGFTVKFVDPATLVTVTSSVTGGNGTVTTAGQNPAGETVLERGESRVWTVTPAAGFVPKLLPSSTCTGTLSTAAPYTYTVTSAAANCTVNFAFEAASTGTVASIPTLSEWGLIILSALMGLMALGMRRRRMF